MHTIGVSMTVPLVQVHAFVDIGYKHAPFINQIPSGLPPPYIDPFKVRLYDCRYYITWQCQAWSGFSLGNYSNTTYDQLIVHNKLLKPASWLIDDVEATKQLPVIVDVTIESTLAENIAKSSSIIAYQTSIVGLLEMSNKTLTTERVNGVMYTFGHMGREDYLIGECS